MSALSFPVTGIPGAQGSKRHVGRGIMVESSKKVKPWRTDVKVAAEQAVAAVTSFDEWAPINEPCRVTLDFAFARPQSHYGTGRNAGTLKDSAPTWVTSRACGDADKLARSTLDALTAAGVIVDDSLVAVLTVTKTYCAGAPGARITVEAIPADEGMAW